MVELIKSSRLGHYLLPAHLKREAIKSSSRHRSRYGLLREFRYQCKLFRKTTGTTAMTINAIKFGGYAIEAELYAWNLPRTKHTVRRVVVSRCAKFSREKRRRGWRHFELACD